MPRDLNLRSWATAALLVAVLLPRGTRTSSLCPSGMRSDGSNPRGGCTTIRLQATPVAPDLEQEYLLGDYTELPGASCTNRPVYHMQTSTPLNTIEHRYLAYVHWAYGLTSLHGWSSMKIPLGQQYVMGVGSLQHLKWDPCTYTQRT